MDSIVELNLNNYALNLPTFEDGAIILAEAPNLQSLTLADDNDTYYLDVSTAGSVNVRRV